MSIRDDIKRMKQDAPKLAQTSGEMRNRMLANIAQALEAKGEEIFEENHKDLQAAKDNGVPEAVQKRLKFDEGKLQDVVSGIKQLISLPDPLGNVQMARALDDGLELYRVSCPIGVIGVIFEARPDALVQISSLCVKSGNCAVLKGGKETAKTNKILFDIIKDSAIEAGLPKHCLLQAELHEEIDQLLSCQKEVDLLIPRGSNAFVQYIMENTKIPVLGHADGICHIYVDEQYDMAKALPVIIDAKSQYPAACNAVETILVNRKIAKEFVPTLAKELQSKGIKMRGTQEVAQITPCEVMREDDFATEYLDLILSVKLVENVEEAIEHINAYGSHHTDGILTENTDTAKKFMQMVDSAGVYHNCSTRFADGFRYGFGAEVGISTSKIHARGPVGLEGLVTYKYKLYGKGDIVADYATGKKQFKHTDL